MKACFTSKLRLVSFLLIETEDSWEQLASSPLIMNICCYLRPCQTHQWHSRSSFPKQKNISSWSLHNFFQPTNMCIKLRRWWTWLVGCSVCLLFTFIYFKCNIYISYYFITLFAKKSQYMHKSAEFGRAWQDHHSPIRICLVSIVHEQ